MCSGHCIALHRGACRGVLQARRERRLVLQVPEVLCQYRGEDGRRMCVRRPSVSVPCGWGTAPHFICQGESSLPERLRGWWRRGCSASRRPRADSRVPLTGGRTKHSGGRGDVLSPCALTTSGMSLQCPEWRYSALQWRGWPYRADSDGEDRSRRPDVRV
jgi:hypothetical protein